MLAKKSLTEILHPPVNNIISCQTLYVKDGTFSWTLIQSVPLSSALKTLNQKNWNTYFLHHPRTVVLYPPEE